MPNITGQFVVLDRATFDQFSNGQFVHFPDRFTDNSKTVPIFHSQPARLGGQVELVNQGITTRTFIENLFLVHGDPLFGILLSSGDSATPHLAIVRETFNDLRKSGPGTPDRVQEGLDDSLELLYKNEKTVNDPEDPDFGQTMDERSFWVATHVFNFDADGLYDPVAVVPDYKLRVSNTTPPGNWWQES